MFPFNFAPNGWATCNGQLLPVARNTQLFGVLGTIYGGNGTSTFMLPNLAESAAMHYGDGKGLSPRTIGGSGGEATVTLTLAELPVHGHSPGAAGAGNSKIPAGDVWSEAGAVRPAPNCYAHTIGAKPPMAANIFLSVGGGQPHNNLMPFLGLNFCIALQGIVPGIPDRDAQP